LSENDFQTLSPLLEHHTMFPERTSVMWAQVLNRGELKLRIWERGVQEAGGTTGETLACGTWSLRGSSGGANHQALWRESASSLARRDSHYFLARR
jgi:diaminopimelate epimerase